jgi:hypothetical protein
LSPKSPNPLNPQDWEWIPDPKGGQAYPPPPPVFPDDQGTCKRICDYMLAGLCQGLTNLLEKGQCIVDWRKWCYECTFSNACRLPASGSRRFAAASSRKAM